MDSSAAVQFLLPHRPYVFPPLALGSASPLVKLLLLGKVLVGPFELERERVYAKVSSAERLSGGDI